MRLVLDTDVVVAAMRSPTGASAALLVAALDGRVTMLANVALMLEYEAVCSRGVHLEAAGLSAGEVGAFLDAIAALVEPVESHYVWRPRLRDPGDEMVLEAAVNGHAEAIVTFNTRDYGSEPSEFGIRVLLPRDGLRSLTR
jgi:putative PIN family toxin of toxin-antitoxin system